MSGFYFFLGEGVDGERDGEDAGGGGHPCCPKGFCFYFVGRWLWIGCGVFLSFTDLLFWFRHRRKWGGIKPLVWFWRRRGKGGKGLCLS